MHDPPRPSPGENGCPNPKNFQDCPAPPHPENALSLTVTLPRSEDFTACPSPKFFSSALPRSKKRLPRASLIFTNCYELGDAPLPDWKKMSRNSPYSTCWFRPFSNLRGSALLHQWSESHYMWNIFCLVQFLFMARLLFALLLSSVYVLSCSQL